MVAFEAGTLIILLLILVLGLLVPELFRKLKIPFVTALILIGTVLGPHGFDYVQSNEILEFFGFLGVTFLMLLAGIEVQTKHFANLKKRIFIMTTINGAIPFIVGFGIVLALGYSLIESLLVGIIFISSGVVVVIELVKGLRLSRESIGETMISSAVIQDIATLLLLAFILQGVAPITKFPIWAYFLILFFSVYFLKKFLPIIAKFFIKHYRKHVSAKRDEYEEQLHFVLILLIGILIYFSGLGVHPIIAAFLVGLLLSDVMTSKILHHKLHTLAYGLFVPVFFFLVGMQLDLGIIFKADGVLMLLLIIGLITAKFFSGYFAGILAKFSKKESEMFGVGSIVKLTTALAVVYTTTSLGILSPALASSIVVLVVVTTILAPITLNFLAQKLKA